MSAKLKLLCLLPALLLAGCDTDDTERPPQARMTVINAAPGFASLRVRRGRSADTSTLAALEFAGRATASFDSGSYNFTVESFDSITSIASEEDAFTQEIQPEQNHLLVLTEENDTVRSLLFTRPPFSSSSANWELNLVNAAEGLGSVDLYIVPSGTDITTVSPNTSLAVGEQFAPGELQPGLYEFTLTEVGNAANVLFTSTEIDFPAGLSIEAAIVVDTQGRENKLTLIGTTGSDAFTLLDTSIGTSMRFVNGAADELPRDIYLEDDFATPFADDIPFADATSSFVEAPRETSRVSITPGDNASVVEAELVDLFTPGAIYNILIEGTAGDITTTLIRDIRLPDNTHAQIMFLNTVSTSERLLIWVRLPGTDTTDPDILPNISLLAPAGSDRDPIPAATYELTVRDSDTSTVVLGPQTIALEAGGIYTIWLVDSGDGTTINAVLLDDFQ